MRSDESGESTLQCNVGATVSGSAVVLDEALVADNGFTCSAVYAITTDDVNNLERDNTVTVYAKDVFGYEVSASHAELVDLHQVKILEKHG